jgi:hypothetical protein
MRGISTGGEPPLTENLFARRPGSHTFTAEAFSMRKDWRIRVGGGASSNHLFGGLLVMSVGVIFLLNNLEIIEARQFFRTWFWPLLLIAVGVMQLLVRREKQ